jgi:hypothetical protein
MASLSVVGLKENIGDGRNLAAASTIVKLPYQLVLFSCEAKEEIHSISYK